VAATIALSLGLLPGVAPVAAGEKITVTHWGVLMYGAPYAVAMEKGYYKEQGLDIDGVLTSKGGGTTMRNVMASDLPYGEVALSAAVAASKQGIDVRIVHTGVRSAGDILWVVTPESDIKTIKDLAGKKVAFTSPKSVTEMVLVQVMAKHGITTENIAAGGIGTGLTMLQQNAVAAAPILDPVWTRMQGKLRPIFFAKDELPPMVQTVGVTTAEFAKANPDKLRKLVAARRKGVAFLYANPEESADILAKAYEIDRAIALKAINNLRELRYWSEGPFEIEGMNEMVKGLKVVGEISEAVDWSKLLDRSVVE
jgi:NitT/TauT family transport system substrate-binding protein